MKDKYLDIAGTKIHYKIKGNAKAVYVWVHGFPESLENWGEIIDKFEREKIILIDLPGFGKSDLLAEVQTMELFADVVKEVLDAEGIKKCIYVGHSMGGYIGLEFAKKYKDNLQGLVLLNSHAKEDGPEKKEARLRQVELLKKEGKSMLMRELIPIMFAPQNVDKFKDVIDKFINIAKATSTEAIISALLGMRLRPDNLNFVQNVDIPLLMIAGENDLLIPLSVVQEHENPTNPNLLIKVIKNVGHASFIENPEKTAEIIKNFVNS